MKISEITVADLANYMRIDDASEIELSEIERMRSSAIAFMSDYKVYIRIYHFCNQNITRGIHMTEQEIFFSEFLINFRAILV